MTEKNMPSEILPGFESKNLEDALVLIQEGLDILKDNPDANITFTGVIRNGKITVITKDSNSN
jgi:hypothetical protein